MSTSQRHRGSFSITALLEDIAYVPPSTSKRQYSHGLRCVFSYLDTTERHKDCVDHSGSITSRCHQIGVYGVID